MKSKERIETEQSEEEMGDLKGWEYYTQQFEAGPNLLKVLQQKIALPGVESKKRIDKKSLKKIQHISTIPELPKNASYTQKKIKQTESKMIYQQTLQNHRIKTFEKLKLKNQKMTQIKQPGQAFNGKPPFPQQTSQKQINIQNLSQRSKKQNCIKQMNSLGVIKVRLDSRDCESRDLNKFDKRKKKLKNRISMDVLTKQTKRKEPKNRISEISADFLEKKGNDSKINWKKFRLSRERPNLENKNEKIENYIKLKLDRFDRNKTLNVMSKKIHFPSSDQDKNREKRTYKEIPLLKYIADDFTDDHLQIHQRINTHFL